VIVPDGALFEAPFDALPVDDGVLWSRYDLSYAASASLLVAARQASASRRGTADLRQPDLR